MFESMTGWLGQLLDGFKDPRKLLEEAARARAQKQRDRAREILNGLLRSLDKRAASDAEARGLRAEACALLGDVEYDGLAVPEAVAHYRRAMEFGCEKPHLVRIVAEAAASAADESPLALDAYLLCARQSVASGKETGNDAVWARIARICRLDLTQDGQAGGRQAPRLLAFAQRVLEIDPLHAAAHRALGVCHCLLGRDAEGARSLALAEQLDPRDPDLPRLLAVALLRQDPRHPEAEAPLRRALAPDPRPALRVQLALVLVPEQADSGTPPARLDEARQLLLQASEPGPDAGQTLYHLGRVERLRGHLQAARSALEQAVALLPAHVEALWLLAQVLAELSLPEASASVLGQLLEQAPEDMRARRLLGVLLAGQGQHAQAEAQFARVLAHDPADAATRIALGHARHALQDWPGVVHALGPAAAGLPLRSSLELARALDRCGRTRDALAACEAARARSEPDAELLHRVGCLHGRLDQPQAALAAFDEARALLDAADAQGLPPAPGRGDIALARGQALLRLARWEDAAAAFADGAALAPQEAEAPYGSGVCAARLGRPQEARAAFERALALDARHALAWYACGLVTEASDPAAAVDCYRQALAVAPDDAACQARLGIALTKTREWMAALQAFQHAGPESPDQVERSACHGLALAMCGAVKEALALWQPLQAVAAPWLGANLARANFALGRQAHQQGRYAAALEHFDAAAAHEGSATRARQGAVEAGLALALQALKAVPSVQGQARPGAGTGDDATRTALPLLLRCRELAPDDARIAYCAGSLALARGDARQAVALLEPVAAADAGSWQPACHLALARLAAGNEAGLQAARSELAALALTHPDAAPVRLALAEAEARCGHWQEAFEHFCGAAPPQAAAYAGDQALLLRTVECGLRCDRLDEVERLADPAATPAQARRQIGMAHARAGHLDAALSWLRPLADAQGAPRDLLARTVSALLAQRASAAAAAGDLQAAARDAAQAVALDEDNATARDLAEAMRAWLVRAALAAGDMAGAARHAWQAFESQRWDPYTIHGLGVVCWRWACEAASSAPAAPLAPDALQRWHTAIACLALALHSPAFRRRYLERLPEDVELGPDDFDQARKAVGERLLSELRRIAAAARQAGSASSAQAFGELQLSWELEAEAACLVADMGLESRAPDWPAGVAGGPLMFELWCRDAQAGKRVAGLRKSLERMRTKSSTRLHALLSPLGRQRWLIDQGRVAEAVAGLRSWTDSAPAKRLLAEALALLGHESVKQRQYQAAMESFEELHTVTQAAGHEDDIEEAALGAALEAENEAEQVLQGYKAAIGWLERGLTLAPDRPNLRRRLAKVYMRRANAQTKEQKHTAALADMRKALALDGSDEDLKRLGAIVTWNAAHDCAAKSPATAVPLVLESWALEHDLKILRMFGNLLAENGHFNQAIDLLNKLKRSGAQGPEWNFAMAEVLIEQSSHRLKRKDTNGGLAAVKEAYRICPSHPAFRDWHP